MRIVCAVIEISAGSVPNLGQDLSVRRTVTSQPIRDDAARLVFQSRQQTLEEALRCRRIPPVLHQDVEHDAVLVDCAPEVMQRAADPQIHLIEVPDVAWLGPPSAELAGEVGAELDTPLPDALAGNGDASLGQHQLHVAQAQAEDVVKPYGIADDCRREAVAGVGRGLCRHHASMAPPSRSGQWSPTCQCPWWTSRFCSTAGAPPRRCDASSPRPQAVQVGRFELESRQLAPSASMRAASDKHPRANLAANAAASPGRHVHGCGG